MLHTKTVFAPFFIVSVGISALSHGAVIQRSDEASPPLLPKLKVEPSTARQNASRERNEDEIAFGLRATNEGRQLTEYTTDNKIAWKEAKATGSYLNGLVQRTVAETAGQVVDVVYLRTHKTGSTTLAAVMYRYATRHRLKLSLFGGGPVIHFKEAVSETRRTGQFVDMVHYHTSATGKYQGTWPEAVKHYRNIVRNPDHINFVTVLREPRSHFLSWYYYYRQPGNQLSIEEFLETPHHEKDMNNLLAAEFGIQNMEEMERFVQDSLPDFKLVLLTERLEEGLMVLRRMFQWHMIDMVYFTLNETKTGERRWDSKPVINRPSFDSLPEKVQRRIDELTNLDRVLYDACVNKFDKVLAQYANVLQQDVTQFRELQGVVASFLGSNPSSPGRLMYGENIRGHLYANPPKNYPF